MVTSTRVTLTAINATMPPLRATSLKNSSVVCYDNMTRVSEADKWTYNGGPNLNTTYTGPTGYIALLGAYCSRPDKTRYEWSYSMANAVALANAIKPELIGGNINGLVNDAPALAAFGSKTLYGSRYYHVGTPNSLADVTNPAERARLLGDDPAAATYTDNMRGISNWAAYSPIIKTILHDDGACMFASHSGGGSFNSGTWAGFSSHGSGLEYGAYLRTVYADDAAYTAARPLGTVPAYADARKHLFDAVFAWHGVARARALSHGMDYALNVANPYPTKHPQGPYPMVSNADYGICELAWQLPWREGTGARIPSDRAAAELLSDATTLRRGFASQAMFAAVMRGSARKAAFAVWPLLDWLPPKSGGASSPPVTTPYTIPYKVAAHQRMSWAWLQAWGCPNVIPCGVYDEAAGDVADFGYTGYTGLNKPLYYMAPDTAKPWFDWVANNGTILDGFDLAATFAIVQPLGTNFWRGAVDGVGNTAWIWMDSYVRPLVEAGVPFVILPVDSTIGYPSSSYDLTKYRATVTAVNDVASMPGGLSDHAPVTVAGSADSTRPVFCVPRIDRSTQRLALHVVNSHSCDYAAGAGAGGAGTTQTAITLTLKPWAMLTRTIKSAWWYSHEATTQRQPVRVLLSAQGPTITVPAFLEAGVVLLEFA